MRIATIGKGNIGNGYAQLWQASGHEVQTIGREGGDVTNADVVLLAVPGEVVAAALDSVTGVVGKPVIDATNLVGGSAPPGGFASNAQYVRSRTNGPTAKALNTNFADLLDRVKDARARPSSLWCGDAEIESVVEQLINDAGFEPVKTGDLEEAPALEAVLGLLFSVRQGGLGSFVYRLAPPSQL